MCVYVHLNCRRKKNERKKRKYIYFGTNVIKVGLCTANVYLFTLLNWHVLRHWSRCKILDLPTSFSRAVYTYRFIVQETRIYIENHTKTVRWYVKPLNKAHAHPKIEHCDGKKIRFTNRKGQFVHSFQYIDSIQYRALYRTQPIRLCCR